MTINEENKWLYYPINKTPKIISKINCFFNKHEYLLRLNKIWGKTFESLCFYSSCYYCEKTLMIHDMTYCDKLLVKAEDLNND